MKIRRAAPRDFKRLYNIGKSAPELRTVDRREFMTKEDFLFCMRNKDGRLLLAEEQGEPVGFAYSVKEAPTYAAFVYLVVSPDYRGKGVGTALLKESVKEMRKRGVRSMYGLATNKKAVRFMERFGFKAGKRLVWLERKV